MVAAVVRGLDALAAKQVVPGYIGFDATAPSLHVGNLVSIMLLRRVQQTLAVASDVIVVNQTWAPMEALNLHCVKVLAPGLTPVT